MKCMDINKESVPERKNEDIPEKVIPAKILPIKGTLRDIL